MAQEDFLSVSNGSGDAALMHITADRLAGATTISVDTVTNVPTKFIGTMGSLGSNNLITPATKRDFRGHVSGSTLVIDAFEPGSTDAGNTIGQVVIIKPTTGWADRVATFVKNATNFGTPQNIWAAILTAASAVLSGNLSVGGGLTVTGNADVSGNLTVSGTSRVVAATVASGGTITPSKQIYDVTALAVPATIAVPSFTPQNGMCSILRIKDNGGAQGLTFASGYTNVSGLDTPTATVAGKLLTIGSIYNSATSKWEIQSISQQA